MRLEFAAATDVGLHRSENQDRYLADGSMFAVADGLGGHHGGATAAAIVTDVLTEREPVGALDDLVALVGAANVAVHDAAQRDPILGEMATTLCVLAGVGERLVACNVGDSRLYALTAAGFGQLTVDHTIVENLLRDGVISAAEAATHPDRHRLTRVVGFERPVYVDAWELASADGARFLICSDGLTNEVSDSDIAAILVSAAEPAAAATSLVEHALCPGHGRDNVTVVVVDVAEGSAAAAHPDQLVLGSRSALPA